jgi:DNA modification methylase
VTIAEPLQALAVPVENLAADPDNARRGDVAAVRRSLTVFGQRKPVVAKRIGTDEQGRPTGIVEAGNTTFAAACDLGWTHIAAVFIDDDPTTARAFALADNRTGELATWDEGQLVESLLGLETDEFDLAALGWSPDDLTKLLGGEPEPDADPDDEIPEAPSDPVTKSGDVWRIGPHRLICGDCRDPQVFARLLDGVRVNVAFTSPPYASQRKYDESSGFEPVPPDDYVEWFAPVQDNVRAVLADDGSWFVNIKPSVTPDGLDTETYVLDLVLAHVRRWGWHWGTEYCWERNCVPKNVTRRFKNQFEPVYQFALNDWKMRPDAVRHWSENVPISRGEGVGDTSWKDAQGNGWAGVRARKNGTSKTMSKMQGTAKNPGEYMMPGMAYPGNRLPTFAGTHEATGHTAAFPVGLPSWFIRAYTDPGDAVLDPFAGSGSTIIAADNEQRIGYGIEISPAYCDVICRRYQQHTGTVPVLESSGEPHDFKEGEDNG